MVAGVGKVTRLARAAAPHRLPEVIHSEQIGAQAPPPGDVPKSPHAPRSVGSNASSSQQATSC